MKKIFIVFSLLILVIIVIISSFKGAETGTKRLKIYFFNAGKADAIVLSKNGKYIMIDTGEASLSSEILDYFEKNNITKLDYLIITHFDKDHVGSASSVIKEIEIGEVLESNVPKESEYYNAYLDALNSKNISPKTVSGNYEIYLDDIKLNINGPDKIYDKNESNNSSLIVSFKYNEKSFLFMGDAENARIKDFLSSNNLTFDFIKIPYHGNYQKRLEELLSEVKSSYAVITCSNNEGAENDVLSLLNKYNVKYFLTKNGDITVTSDGKNISISQ